MAGFGQTGNLPDSLSSLGIDHTLKAWQCSERGGELYVKAFDNKVELGGKTVTLLKGTMTLSDE